MSEEYDGRGDPRDCVECKYNIHYGAGHKVTDDQTGEVQWLCCECFEKSVASYLEALKEEPK